MRTTMVVLVAYLLFGIYYGFKQQEYLGGGEHWPMTYGEALIIPQPIGSALYDFLTTNTPSGEGGGYISDGIQRCWTGY